MSFNRVDICKGIVAIVASERLKRKGFELAGTAFLVQGQGTGVLITCAHVLENAKREGDTLYFRFGASRTEYAASLVTESPIYEADLAILLPESLPVGLETLPVCSVENPGGHPFATYGYLQKGDFKALHARGTIGGYVLDNDRRERLQISTDGKKELRPGYSGAPVLDETLDAVIGVINMGFNETPDETHFDTSFAVTVADLQKMYPELVVKVHRDKPSIQLPPPTAPSPLAYFVGRDKQREEIIAIITKDNSQSGAVALLGMGGIGKTSLAKQIARDVAKNFPGGVFWGDELPSKGNPSIILKQWGRLCGQNLEKESEENLPTVVRGLLTAYQSEFGAILVIVDEVRLDWAGDGVEAIRQALPPDVPLLVTTRQAQVAQELDAKIFILDVFSRAESIQLLLAFSEGKIAASQADTFAELCGDMPLALELMAKLTKRRKSSWLLERLQDETNRLDILKLDDARKKEQSVKLSFDLNYQSLAEQYPESARIFRSLAAFARPTFIIFEHLANTLAQVNQQKFPGANSEKRAKRAAEDDLLRLVDWSFLAEETLEGSEMQYFHLHTLLHEYAQSLLADEAELTAAVDTQIKYCVAFAAANPQIDLQIQRKSTLEFEKSSGQMFEALTQIKERDMAGGIGWENDSGLARQVILLVDAADYHWQWHSHFADQVEWLPVAYHCAGAQKDSLKQADFARRLGRVLSWQGQLDEASAWMEHCQGALGADASEAANAIRALMYVHRAAILYQKNELESAEASCRRGLDLVSEKKQPKTYAEGCNLLGVIKIRTGDLEAALEVLQQSLVVWKQVGDQYQINRVSDNLRATLYYLGDIAQSRKIGVENLQYWEQFPQRIELAMALTNHGLTLCIDREYEAAIHLHQRALEISDLLSVQRMRALIRVNLAEPYMALGRYAEAEDCLNQSLEIQTEFDITEHWIDAKRGLAEVAIGRKLYARAIELAENALQLAREDDDPLEEGAARRVLGQAYYLSGELEQARQHLENSLSLLRDNGYKYETFLTWQVFIPLYVALSETQKAQAARAEAQALSKEMGLIG